jgi:hypothetical protein
MDSAIVVKNKIMRPKKLDKDDFTFFKVTLLSGRIKLKELRQG